MAFKKFNTEKVEAAIADFENHVDCELVPVITYKSSYTAHIGWMISLILMIVFIGLVDFFFYDSWESRTLYYVVTPILAVVLGHLLDKIDIVDRFFIPKKERARQVFEKAQRVFFLKRLSDIQSGNALMLFVSVMERKIVILPDPRLKLTKIEEIQKNLIHILRNEFKKGHFEEGFLKAIDYLKHNLSAELPKTNKQSANLIANKLTWWD